MDNFECTACGETFETSEELAEHIESVHVEKEMPDFQCGVCGENFGTKQELIDHIRAAHPSS
jgi:uncharacterized C2H2 Zn-finger protein